MNTPADMQMNATISHMPETNAPVVNAAVANAPSFADFGLPESMQKTLQKLNYTMPTPIQVAALPLALSGRDILGSAQTGTGKTAAFGIPLLVHLMQNPQAQALVMTPTRELAVQVAKALQQLIPFNDKQMSDIKCAVLIGGEAMPIQMRQLKMRPRLIVGTPGRINDHLARGTLRLSNTTYLVLDETDRMLDMGFGPQIDKILEHVPAVRQTLLFSATLPGNIVKLSSRYMREPVRVAVGSTSAPIAKIKQELVRTSEGEKYHELLSQLENRDGSIIIFVKTKHGTERLAEKLCRANIPADAIHGDLQQRQRQRVIEAFRRQDYRILVATDVAARGLDIPHIAHVINYDLPQVAEDYIHRIGRTARAGAEGSAVNLLTPADNGKWRAIQQLLGEKPSNSNGGESMRQAPNGKNGSRKFSGARKSGDRSFGDRSFGDRSFGDRKFGARNTDERKFSDRNVGERSFEEKRFGDKKPASRKFDQNSGPENKYSERKYSERKYGEGNFAEPSFGEQKPFYKKAAGKSFGKKDFGQGRPTSGKPTQGKPTGGKFGGKNKAGSNNTSQDASRQQRSWSPTNRAVA